MAYAASVIPATTSDVNREEVYDGSQVIGGQPVRSV
jgi:hypothetical protein